MTKSKRLRIIYQVLQEIRTSRNPIGWRKIKKRFDLKESQAKSIYQTILDLQHLSNFLPDKPTIIHAPKLTFDRVNKSTVFILCSDWHIGEIVDHETVKVNKYNLNIAYYRALKYLENIGSILKQHSPQEIILCLLGDLVSGIIHKELEEQTNILDQISLVAYLGTLFIKTIKPTKVIAVYGNHGQVRQNGSKKKSKNLKNNFDLVAYKMMELLSGRKIITSNNPFIIEKTQVGICSFTHGDYVNGYAGLPMHALIKKQIFVHNFCQMQGIPPPKYSFLAHFHEPQNITQMNEKLFINGTMMGVNEYALQRGLICEPSQKIVIISDAHEMVINIKLDYIEEPEINPKILDLRMHDG